MGEIDNLELAPLNAGVLGYFNASKQGSEQDYIIMYNGQWLGDVHRFKPTADGYLYVAFFITI